MVEFLIAKLWNALKKNYKCHQLTKIREDKKLKIVFLQIQKADQPPGIQIYPNPLGDLGYSAFQQMKIIPC
uniref:Transcriptional adaptor n=1 Tax=Rhizophora mucronata TaxID=61149 RepID=A0A2P2L1C9_RHIMU